MRSHVPICPRSGTAAGSAHPRWNSRAQVRHRIRPPYALRRHQPISRPICADYQTRAPPRLANGDRSLALGNAPDRPPLPLKLSQPREYRVRTMLQIVPTPVYPDPALSPRFSASFHTVANSINAAGTQTTVYFIIDRVPSRTRPASPTFLMTALLDFFIGVGRAYFAILNDADPNSRLIIGQCLAGRIAQFQQSLLIPQIRPGLGINHDSCHRLTSRQKQRRETRSNNSKFYRPTGQFAT